VVLRSVDVTMAGPKTQVAAYATAVLGETRSAPRGMTLVKEAPAKKE
jgi:hypothetical protein